MQELEREERLEEIQGGMTGVEMANALGISPSTWVLRKNRFVTGQITEDKLLRWKRQPGNPDDPLNEYEGAQRTNEEMADILGISVGVWLSRKCRYRHKECTCEVLYHHGNAVPRRSRADRRKNGLSALSDIPRPENLRRIRSGTMDHLF